MEAGMVDNCGQFCDCAMLAVGGHKDILSSSLATTIDYEGRLIVHIGG